MKNEFINLTPHSINIYKDGVCVLEIPASGTVARVVQEIVPYDKESIGGILINTVRMMDIENMPCRKDGVSYIVSLPVLMALHLAGDKWDRDDCYSPSTNLNGVRNEKGQIIGVEGLLNLW